MSKHVKVDLSGLKKYGDIIRRDLAGSSGSGPIRRVFGKWAVRWRSFQKLGFTMKSRGGGGWKPLAASTKRQRRSGKGSGSAAILWDKFGSIMKALTPAFTGQAGQYEKNLTAGIRVGFGGPGRHPDGAATIADIASFHDAGTATIPARQILDDPDSALLTTMTKDMEDACVKLAKQTSIVR